MFRFFGKDNRRMCCLSDDLFAFPVMLMNRDSLKGHRICHAIVQSYCLLDEKGWDDGTDRGLVRKEFFCNGFKMGGDFNPHPFYRPAFLICSKALTSETLVHHQKGIK